MRIVREYREEQDKTWACYVEVTASAMMLNLTV
jgi:hypothetical protein